MEVCAIGLRCTLRACKVCHPPGHGGTGDIRQPSLGEHLCSSVGTDALSSGMFTWSDAVTDFARTEATDASVGIGGVFNGCFELQLGDAEGQWERSTPEGWTIERVWEEYLEPTLVRHGRAGDTIGEYRTAVSRWTAFCQYRMAYPVLNEIKRRTLEEFRTYDVEQYGGSNRTLNKHVDRLIGILRCAEGHELLDSVPKVPPLEAASVARKLYLQYDQVDRLYRACSVATYPREDSTGRELPYDAPKQWRAALVMFFSYGFRTRELVKHLRRNKALRWGNLHWQRETPHHDGVAENEWGWLSYVPMKQRRLKPEALVLPLSEIAAAHLSSIRPASATSDQPVFDWKLSSDLFYDQWERICQAANVRPKPDLETGECGAFEIKHFRKTCETWYAHHFTKDVAEAIIGHAPRSISARHYINQEQKVLAAVNGLPLPPSFQAIYEAGDRQRMLFD